MKRVLLALLAVIIAFSVCGCNNNSTAGNQTPDNDCVHSYSQTTLSYTLKKEGDKDQIYTEQKCVKCNEQGKVSGIIVSSQTQIGDAIRDAQKGDVIYFKKVRYLEINVLKAIEGITFFAEEGASIEKISFRAEEGVKDIVIDGFHLTSYDLGGILFHTPADKVTIRNCSFEGSVQIADYENVTPLIQNLVVENCKFYAIYRSPTAKITAIRIRNLNNFTLINSDFDIIQYNVVQVGSGEANALTGRVVVSGCSFRDTGDSVLYFVYNRTDSLIVENNLFYSNEDYEYNGRYVRQREGHCVVGVNTWESIPAQNDQAFSGYTNGFVTYNEAEQLQMELN